MRLRLNITGGAVTAKFANPVIYEDQAGTYRKAASRALCPQFSETIDLELYAEPEFRRKLSEQIKFSSDLPLSQLLEIAEAELGADHELVKIGKQILEREIAVIPTR